MRLNAWVDWQQHEPVPVAVAPADDERVRILACGLYASRGSPAEAVETFAAMVVRGDKPTTGSFLREARKAFQKLTEAASAHGG